MAHTDVNSILMRLSYSPGDMQLKLTEDDEKTILLIINTAVYCENNTGQMQESMNEPPSLQVVLCTHY